MKAKKPITALLSLLFVAGAASCASTVGGKTSSSAADDPFVPVSENTIPTYSDVSYDFTVSASGGYLNDFYVGMPAAVGHTYLLTFSFSNADTSSAEVTFLEEGVFSAQKNAQGNWTITALAPGQAHIQIMDGDGVIHFRYVFHAKNPLSEEEAAESLSYYDHWTTTGTGFEAYCGYIQSYFFNDGSATLAGREIDSGSVDGFTFNWASSSELLQEAPTYNDGEWYAYTITNWTATDAYILKDMFLNVTGSTLHIHTNNSLFAIMLPTNQAE